MMRLGTIIDNVYFCYTKMKCDLRFSIKFSLSRLTGSIFSETRIHIARSRHGFPDGG